MGNRLENFVSIFQILKDGSTKRVLQEDVTSVFPRYKNKEPVKYFVAEDNTGNLYQSTDAALVSKFDDQLIEQSKQKRDADIVDLATKTTQTKTGELIGAYAKLEPEEYVNKITNDLNKLADQGADSRYWYERSGQNILRYTQGNIQDADKFAQLIAIYSPQTTVEVNTQFAIKAWNKFIGTGKVWNGEILKRSKMPEGLNKTQQTKWKQELLSEFGGAKKSKGEKASGLEIIDLDDGSYIVAKHGDYENVSAKSRDLKAHMVLANMLTDWQGRKTSNFYTNIMASINPALKQSVTSDLWMARAFGFGTDEVRDVKYDFIESVINKISDEKNWQPHQTQAAVWIAAKSNIQGTELTTAARDFADFLDDNLAQISWESVPSTQRIHLNGINKLPSEVKADYHVQISQAFTDHTGKDVLASKIGLLSPGEFDTPGFYEGISNPSTQTQVAATRIKGAGKLPTIDDPSKKNIELYAAMKGMLLKQDSVGYHRPFYKAATKDNNGVEIVLNRRFTEVEIQELSQLLNNEGIALIGSENGMRLLNFSDLDNKAFKEYIESALDNFSVQEGQLKYFATDGDLVSYENYEDIIRQSRRSDLQGIFSDFLEKIENIDRTFAEQHGLKFDENEYKYLREFGKKISTQ